MTADIIETQRATVMVFTAHSDRGRLWMRDRFGGRTEVSYGVLAAASDFRKQARKALLIIHRQAPKL
jgi:hypothetical protein